MARLTPVNYNNLESQDTTKHRGGLFALLGAALREPRARRVHRLIIIGLLAVLTSVAWLIAGRETEAEALRVGVLMAGAGLSVFYVLATTALHFGHPYLRRLLITGLLIILTWTLSVALLAFAVEGAHLAIGLLITWALALVICFLPVWLIVLQPGEVLDITPLVGNLEFVSAPMDAFEAAKTCYRWVAPVDSVRLFWRLDDRLILENRYDYITTREGYQFALQVRLAAEFDPAQIRTLMFRNKLMQMGSKPEIQTMLRTLINSQVELCARNFFIDMPHREALAAGSVTLFKRELPGIAGPRLEALGLKILGDTITCIPFAGQETQRAADRAAAAPFETVANTAVQKDLLQQALEGSVPAQLVLYAQMVASGTSSGYVPSMNAAPMADQFLKAINAHDKKEARRLFDSIFGEAEDAQYRKLPSTERRRSFDLGSLDDR